MVSPVKLLFINAKGTSFISSGWFVNSTDILNLMQCTLGKFKGKFQRIFPRYLDFTKIILTEYMLIMMQNFVFLQGDQKQNMPIGYFWEK